MFLTLMSYTTHVANAGEEYHAKDKTDKTTILFYKDYNNYKDDITKRRKINMSKT